MKVTKNSIKYNFSDFTLQHYEEILQELKKNHSFRFFTNFDKNEKFVINRHDIDFSLTNTLQVAQLEHKLGIHSTYLFLLHNEYYNILDIDSIAIVKDIAKMGHKIGLHFDAQFYPIQNEKELDEKIIFEKQILEYYTGVSIEVFSFHNTNKFVLECKEWKYGGLINTYANYFQDQVPYCSDSHGYWRFNRMLDFIKSKVDSPLQILTHPIWWSHEIQPPFSKIMNSIDKRANINKQKYIDLLENVGQEQIHWDNGE